MSAGLQIDQAPIQEYQTVSSGKYTPSFNGSTSWNATPFSPSAPSPASLSESTTSSNLFSDQGDFEDAEDGLESCDAKSDEHLEIDYSETKSSEYAANVLNSHLFTFLGHNLELAARLIPIIYRSLPRQWPYALDAPAYTECPSDGSPSTTTSGSTPSTSISTPGSVRSSQVPDAQKHQRKRNASEEGRGNRRPKSRKRAGNETVRQRGFACHFFKMDPNKYCSLSDRKYRTCAGPGDTELRRIKDHFKRLHYMPTQCAKCFSVLPDRSELIAHQRVGSCQQVDEALKEGIDAGQMERIDEILRVGRGPGRAEGHDHDIEKWFRIWPVLFPNVSRPTHPWYDNIASNAIASSTRNDDILRSIDSIRQVSIASGIITPDPTLHYWYDCAIRLALEGRPNGPIMGQNLAIPGPSSTPSFGSPAGLSERPTTLMGDAMVIGATNRETSSALSHRSPHLVLSPGPHEAGTIHPHDVGYSRVTEMQAPQELSIQSHSTLLTSSMTSTTGPLTHNNLSQPLPPLFSASQHSDPIPQVNQEENGTHHPDNNYDMMGIFNDMNFSDYEGHNFLEIGDAQREEFGYNFDYLNTSAGNISELMIPLELEAESPGAMAEWKGNRDIDRNRSLPKP